MYKPINEFPAPTRPRTFRPQRFRNGDMPFCAAITVDGSAGEIVADRKGCRVTWTVDGHEYSLAGGISLAFRLQTLTTAGRALATTKRDLEELFDGSPADAAPVGDDAPESGEGSVQ